MGKQRRSSSKSPIALIIASKDDPETGKLYEIALGAAGLVPFVVDSGDVALSLMQGSVPDVVTLDLGLEGATGAAVLQHMRADPQLAQVPVIVTTESTELADSIRNAADLVLQKPVTSTKLEKHARLLLEQR